METVAHQLIETEARLGSSVSLHITNAVLEFSESKPAPICVGDTVLITAPIEFQSNEAGERKEDVRRAHAAVQRTMVCLEAEGVADIQVHASEMTVPHPGLHRSLFTIMGCLYQHSGQTYSRKSEREFTSRTEGEPVQYGDEIQLQHVNSGNYLCFSSRPTDRGFQLTLGERAGPTTWIRVLGGIKGTKLGQPVYYHNRVILQAKRDLVEYYMHLYGFDAPTRFAVAAYSEPFSWTFSKFHSALPKETSISLLKPIQFRHKDLHFPLTHSKDTADDWLSTPPSFALRKISDSQLLDIEDVEDNQETEGLKLSNALDDGMCYWRLEAPAVVCQESSGKAALKDLPLSFTCQNTGGVAESKREYLLRNVVTNQYLGADLRLLPQSSVSRAYGPNKDFLAPENCALLTLVTAKVESKSLVDGIDVILCIDDAHLEAEVNEITGKDIFRMIPSRTDTTPKGVAEIILSDASSEQQKYVFEVINTHKSIAKFVEITAELVPQFRRFYNCLGNFGVRDGESHYPTALTQLKEFQRMRDITIRGIEYLEKELTQSTSKEVLEKRQNFIVACGIQTLLIDTARMLLLRLNLTDSRPAIRLAQGRPADFEAVLLSETANLVSKITSFLYFVAFENSVVCLNLSKTYKEICSLFPLSQRFVAHLLAEIYRLIDPPIHNYESYFAQWLDKLETISGDNVEEQAVFLRLVRHLAQEDTNVNPASQLQLVQQMLHGPTAFKLIRVEMMNNEPHIYFFTKKKASQSEFLSQNPELAAIRRDIEGLAYFPLSKLTEDLHKYAIYVAEALLLLTTMCQDGQHQALNCVQDELNFTPSILVTVCSHSTLPITIRRCFVFLATCTILPSSMLMISQTKGETSMTMVQSEPMSESNKGYVDALAKWCYACWTGEVGMIMSKVTSAQALDYLQAVLLLTLKLIDSKTVDVKYAQGLSLSVEMLLIGLINTGKKYKMSHCWEELWTIINGKEDTLDMVYRRKRTTDLTIQLVRLILQVNCQNKVSKLLDFYQVCKSEPQPFSFSSDRFLSQIQAIISDSGNLFLTEDTEIAIPSNTRSILPETIQTEIPKMTRFMGECLMSTLKLTREVRNLMFQLTGDIVMSNQKIADHIESMQLLDSPKLQKYAVQLQTICKRLQVKKGETMLRIQFSGKDPQKVDEVRFELEKLLGVMCRRGKGAEEFTAVQNIARDLMLHSELEHLWLILQDAISLKQSSALMSKSLDKALNNTLLCLYYFVLNNEANRKELLRLLHPSFFSMSVPILPYLIQQLTDFEHVSQYYVGQCYKSVLQKCTFENRSMLGGLEWVRATIRRRDLGKHQDLQNLAAMAIIAHCQMKKVMLFSPSDVESMSELISLLAESAEDNESAASQCRHLISPSVLQECLKASTSASLISAWFYFLQTVYYDLPQTQIADCMSCLLPWLSKFKQNQPGSASAQVGNVLVALVREGMLDQAYPKTQPEKVDLKDKATIYENAMAELWRMLSVGDEWMVKTGICHSLPRLLLKIAQSKIPISDSLKDICNILQQEFLQIHQIVFRVDKNYNQLDFTLLKTSIFMCFKSFALFLRNELTEKMFSPANLDETSEEDSPHIVMPIALSSKHVVPAETLPVTNSNSIAEPRNLLWAEFVRVIKQVCELKTMSPRTAILEVFMQLPLMQKLASASLTTKEKTETSRCFKGLLKKLYPEYLKVVFRIFEVIVDECSAGTKTNIMLTETLIESGAIMSAIEVVMKRQNLFTVHSALNFLIKALTRQTYETQNWLTAQMLESEAYLPIFQLITQELRASIDRIYSKEGEYLTPTEREIVAPYFSFGATPAELREINGKILVQLMSLVELCCDNCNEQSQLFMRAQNKDEDDPLAMERDSINIVDTLASYFIKLCQGGMDGSGEILIMVNASLEAMTEFVTGPCEENQTDLGTDVQLISSVNTLLQYSYKRSDQNAWVDVMQDSLTFLHTFLEGGNNVKVAESLIRYLNLPFLLTALKEIYDHRIQRHTTDILLQTPSNDQFARDTAYASEIIDVGFGIMMLLLKLQKFFPTHPDLTVLTPSQRDSDLLGLKLSVLSHLPNEYISFYSSLIGYVEITRNGTVESEFFKIPYKCKFLTMNTKDKAIVEAMDLSHHQKIQNFMQLTLLYRREMEHQQNLYRHTWVKDICQAWKIYGWVSFLCIVIINITLLIAAGFDETSYVDSTERKKPINLFTICMGVIQLVFSLVSFVCYLAEYFPNVAERIGLHKEDALEFPEYAGIWHNDSVLMKAYHKTDISLSSNSKLRNILLSYDTLYHIAFLLVSAAAIPIPALYAALLFDVFKRSEELVNIVRAVTQNRKQLILTIIMGIIVVYMFSMVSLVGFNKYFPGDDMSADPPSISSVYCDSLWDCFFTIIHMGTRAGGGLGDTLDPISKDDDLYYPRILLDLLFFAIVILVVQNIIFGIIVDTFGELRDQREELLSELNTQCYVCGVSRKVLERSGRGWVHHFLNEHSLFAYMAFITYVVEKDENECTGLEKYVKDKISQHDASFFPTTSKYLQDKNIELQDDEKDND